MAIISAFLRAKRAASSPSVRLSRRICVNTSVHLMGTGISHMCLLRCSRPTGYSTRTSQVELSSNSGTFFSPFPLEDSPPRSSPSSSRLPPTWNPQGCLPTEVTELVSRCMVFSYSLLFISPRLGGGFFLFSFFMVPSGVYDCCRELPPLSKSTQAAQPTIFLHSR